MRIGMTGQMMGLQGGEQMETMTFGTNISNAAQVYTFFQNNSSYWNCLVFRKGCLTDNNQLAYVKVNASGTATIISRTKDGGFGDVSASVAYSTIAGASDEFYVLRPYVAA